MVNVRYVSLAVFLILFVVPPLFPLHFFPAGTFWNEWLAGMLVLLSWALVWADSTNKVVISHAIVPWGLWGVALLLSILNAHYLVSGPAYMAGIFWLIGVLALFLIGTLRKWIGSERLIIYIAVTLLLSGLLQSVLGLARFFGLLAWFSPWLASVPGHRMAGLLNYPTITGFSVWLSIYATVYLFWKRLVGWTGLIVAMIPMAVAVIATGDRSSILYATALIIISILTIARFSRSVVHHGESFGEAEAVSDSGRKLAGTGIACLIVILAVPAYGGLNTLWFGPSKYSAHTQHVTAPVKNFERGNERFSGIRLSEFKKAIHVARSHPFFGVGPGNYAFQSFRLDSVIKGTVREGTVNTHSHNIFSMVLAENGIIGLCSLLFGVGLLLVWWWKLGASSESLFLGASLGAFFAFSNIEYPLWYLNFLVIFVVLCGLVAPISEKRIDFGWIKPAVAALTLIVGSLVALNMAFGFEEIARVNQSRNLTDKDVNKLAGWSADRLMEPYAMLVMEQYTLPQPKDIDRHLHIDEKLISYRPMPKALLDKAIFLLFKGKNQEACALAERTSFSYPYVLKEYGAEMHQYVERHEKLPGDPARLAPCLNKGKALWDAQWKN